MFKLLVPLFFLCTIISCKTDESSMNRVIYEKDPLFTASYNHAPLNTDILSDKLKEKIYTVEDLCYNEVYNLFQQIVIDIYIQEMVSSSNISYKEALSRLNSSMGFSFLGLSKKEQTQLLYDKISKEKNVTFTYKRDSLPSVNVMSDGFPRIYSPQASENSSLIKVVVFLSLTSTESEVAYRWLSSVKDDSFLKDKVELIYKFCPLSNLDFFISFEKASYCASKQGKFNDYALTVYNSHEDLTSFPQNRFISSIGLVEEEFQKCMSEKFTLLSQSLDEQKRYSITSTPTFFIEGRKFFNIFDIDSLKVAVNDVIEMEKQAKKENK